jgi:hypothetical protein
MQLVTDPIIMAATAQNNIACPFGQNAALLCDKGDEMRLCVSLQMRQIAPIKSHTTIVERMQSKIAKSTLNLVLCNSISEHPAHVGAGALTCPAERSSDMLDLSSLRQRRRRASLACPDVGVWAYVIGSE